MREGRPERRSQLREGAAEVAWEEGDESGGAASVAKKLRIDIV